MKKMFVLGGVFCAVGVAMLFSSFANITGNVILEDSVVLLSRILSSAFLLIGMVFMLMGRREDREENELEKKVGTNVEIHAIFVRHGEKDNEGNLTEKGYEQARAYGRTLGERDLTKAYGSSASRAAKTAEAAVESSPNKGRYGTKVVEGQELRVPKTSKGVRVRQEISMPRMSEEFMDKWVQEARKGGADGAANWYFGLKGRYDKKTDTAEEVAQGFAYIVQKNIRMSGRLEEGYRADLVNGTHQTCPESLLKKVMIRNVNGRKVTGFDKIEEIGGALDYAEPVDFVIKRDEDGKSYVSINFRGHEYEVDMKKLNSLADAYAKRKGKKVGRGK